MMERINLIKSHKSSWIKYLLPIIGIAKSLRFCSDKYKVTHIHSASFVDFYRSSIFVLLHKLLGKKVILHIHGAKFEEFYGKGNRYVDFICHKADALATVSSHFVYFLTSKHLNKHVWLIPNSIPNGAIQNLPKPTRLKNKIIFSYFGALDDRKGIFDVIEAIGKYRHEFPCEITLEIGGTGQTERLKHLIEQYNVADIVNYLGWLDTDSKDTLLRRSDVFIHPSHFESFGISILEAMRYRLPVVTTSIGGIPDLVTDGINGIIVTPGNTRSIADAMIFLIEHPEIRMEMGHNSEQHARDFQLSNIEIKLKELYTSLI